jgi:hypothetical protein
MTGFLYSGNRSPGCTKTGAFFCQLNYAFFKKDPAVWSLLYKSCIFQQLNRVSHHLCLLRVLQIFWHWGILLPAVKTSIYFVLLHFIQRQHLLSPQLSTEIRCSYWTHTYLLTVLWKPWLPLWQLPIICYLPLASISLFSGLINHLPHSRYFNNCTLDNNFI